MTVSQLSQLTLLLVGQRPALDLGYIDWFSPGAEMYLCWVVYG